MAALSRQIIRVLLVVFFFQFLAPAFFPPTASSKSNYSGYNFYQSVVAISAFLKDIEECEFEE
jgi:hypothetical protein